MTPQAAIKRNAPKTLGDTLSDKPGVSASSFALGASRPVIRGLDSVRGENFASCGMGGGEFQQTVYSQIGANLAAQYDLMELGTGMLGVDGRYNLRPLRRRRQCAAHSAPPPRRRRLLARRRSFARTSFLHAFAHTETAPLETVTPGYNLLRAELSYTHQFAEGAGARR